MARFRYDISPIAAGWQVTCNGVAGPPYADKNSAVQDTLAIAEKLRADRHEIDVRLFELDGTGKVLKPQDARLYM